MFRDMMSQSINSEYIVVTSLTLFSETLTIYVIEQFFGFFRKNVLKLALRIWFFILPTVIFKDIKLDEWSSSLLNLRSQPLQQFEGFHKSHKLLSTFVESSHVVMERPCDLLHD